MLYFGRRFNFRTPGWAWIVILISFSWCVFIWLHSHTIKTPEKFQTLFLGKPFTPRGKMICLCHDTNCFVMIWMIYRRLARKASITWTVKPSISMDFTSLSFIYTRTRITWIPRLLDRNFLFRPWSKLHWNFPRTIRILVLVTPLWRHPISSSCCIIGENTKQFYNVIGATNRSRFIKMINMPRFLMK